MRKSLFVWALMVIVAIGCGKKASEEKAGPGLFDIGIGTKVSDEKARQIKPGMAKSEVDALLGSGQSVGGGQYAWTTEKGKLTVTFANEKVSTFIFQAAPRVETEEEKAKEKARTDTMWAEQKKDSDRIARDRDRINDLSTIYTILNATDSGNRLPLDEAAVAASPLANVYPEGMVALRSGRIVVRWGALRTDAVWAYEKDAPTKGGYASGVKYYPAEQLTAEQLKPFVVTR